jgi:predicted amidophosphoribosyltransferase
VGAVLLDLVLPRRCVVCGGPAQALCGSCIDSLRRLGEPRCERCGAPTAWPVERCRECSGRRIAFASARAAVAYDDAARLLVAAWKERGLRKLAALAAELVAEVVPRPSAYTLTFVPADPNRRLDRGHNPAERLAEEIGARWQLPVASLLSRAHGVAPQRGLPLADRRRNVRRVFQATGQAPRAVVLVDDVYTSGATVSAAATALRRAGARRVEVVTFARAMR